MLVVHLVLHPRREGDAKLMKIEGIGFFGDQTQCVFVWFAIREDRKGIGSRGAGEHQV